MNINDEIKCVREINVYKYPSDEQADAAKRICDALEKAIKVLRYTDIEPGAASAQLVQDLLEELGEENEH